MTQAVAEPLATTQISLPPSLHTMRRAASMAAVSDAGGRSCRPVRRPSSRRCGVSTSGAFLRSTSGNSSSLFEVRRARQFRPSASTTSGASVLIRRDTTPTVPPLTRMPGPTRVVVRFAASFATASAAADENVPSESAGSPMTGISASCDWMIGATGSGTASVT